MEKPSTFAKRLNTALERRQISKAELARISGLSKSSITRYVKGDWEAKQDAVYAIAQALNVNEAWLMGYDAPMERAYSELLAAIVEDNKAGRPAAIDEIRRLFGTEHSIHNIYACEDSKRIALLYYKALERRVALSLTDIIDTVDQFDGDHAEKAMLLLHAYLKAGQPIRNIVDTALEPYVEDLDELLCGNIQPDIPVSDTEREASGQNVVSFPKTKVKHRKDAFDELTVFEEDTAAGLGNYLSDAPVTHIEQYPAGMIPAGTNYGVPISGNSMMPKFKNGSTAFVQATPVINDGEIGVFSLNGSSYIKQLVVDREHGTVRLHSLNPNYDDIEVHEGDYLYTFGRVLGSYPQ